jgi:AcrR family transcriptional regulator
MAHAAVLDLSPRKQPIQERSAATVEAILEASIQVLLREGYGKLTTTRIAEVAGVSIGSLYQYFPNKRSILNEIMVRHMAIMADRITRAVNQPLPTPKARINAAVKAFIEVKRERCDLSQAMRAPLAEIEGATLVRATKKKLHKAILPVVRECLPARRQEAAPLVTMMLLAALEGPAMFAIEENPQLLFDPRFETEMLHLAHSYLR